MPDIAIPTKVASHVLHHFGHDGGYAAGDFTTRLLKAIAIADKNNLDRLALGFPEYIAAVNIISYDPNGVVRLKKIAAGA